MPPIVDVGVAEGVPLTASWAALRMASMCAMPSGVAGSPSWVMIMRAALPSGERNSFRPRWNSGLLNDLGWQVEGIVVFGGVERLSQGGRVLQSRLGLGEDPRIGGVIGHRQIAIGLLASDLGRDQCEQLRLQRIQLIQTCGDLSELVGERVDPVDGVEDGAQRPADRDVEAVLLPVEVAAQRPEEVVEISDLVAQFIHRRDRIVKRVACSAVAALGCCCSAYCCLRVPMTLSISATCLSRSSARACW